MQHWRLPNKVCDVFSYAQARTGDNWHSTGYNIECSGDPAIGSSDHLKAHID